MSRIERSVVAVLVGLALTVTWAAPAAPAPTGSTEAEYVVVLEPGTDSDQVSAEHAHEESAEVHQLYEHALEGYAATMSPDAAARIAEDPRVVSVERDRRVRMTAQTNPTGVRRIRGDANPGIGIDQTDDERVDVDVAVIDSGIDLDHPDLDVVASTDCRTSSTNAQGAQVYTCGTGGDDDNNHGTHVAGTIGALDNGIGVVGVAPGARLWAVKVLDADGNGWMGAVIAGIDYVTAHADEIEVANMSLGCECSSAALSQAIANSVSAGVVYTVSAGNSARDVSAFAPANHPDVVTVSALADFNGAPGGSAAPTCGAADVDDTLAYYSNFGSGVEMAAPGSCIRSTLPGGVYGTFSGTSMASPHVAGAAALLASGPNKPVGRSGVQSLVQTLLAAGNQAWNDDSGDGVKEPLLDVGDASTFSPTTVANDVGNAPPNAGDLTVDAEEGTSTPWTPLVSDPSGDALTCGISGAPANGAASVAANCSGGSYTPGVGFAGTDTFGYQVSDGAGGTATAMVSVTVARAGHAAPAVVRGDRWLLRTGLSTGVATTSFVYGVTGDVPLFGDWDGNGSETPAVFRNGRWFLRNSNTTGVAEESVVFGRAGDVPVVGDWDGDGADELGIRRGGAWYLDNDRSGGAGETAFAFGVATDVPLVGDWDGDGDDTVGVFRRGRWFIENDTVSDGVPSGDLIFGAEGDVPVVGDWTASGADRPGVKRGNRWFLRFTLTTGFPDQSFTFGASADPPLVWKAAAAAISG